MAALLLTGLLLAVPGSIPADLLQAPIPDRAGVFAVTDKGTVELTTFGEKRQVEVSFPSFMYSGAELDQIPVVSWIKSIFVTMPGWRPKDLSLIVGREKLATPRDDYRRLTGKASSRGAVRFEVFAKEFQPGELEKLYRQLTKKNRPGDDVRAFVVLELANQGGLDGRGYPIQVEMPPGSAAK